MLVHYNKETTEKLFKSLNPWQLLSFKVFDTDIEYIEDYRKLLRESVKDYYLVHNGIDTTGDIDTINDIDDIDNAWNSYSLKSYLDCHIIAAQNKDPQGNNLPRNSTFLYRHVGNRVDFNSIWKTRNFVYIPDRVIESLFYKPYVYPNILEMLDHNSILALAEYRYTERYNAFVINFKEKNKWLWSKCHSDDIMMIIINYIQPSKFNIDEEPYEPDEFKTNLNQIRTNNTILLSCI